MDSSTPSSESSCERAFALASAWMDGTLAGDERKSFGAHLASCRECDAGLRARLASRAAGAACEERRATPEGGVLSRVGRRLGKFRGALLLACVGAALMASFERTRRAPRLLAATGEPRADGAPLEPGDVLEAGSIVLVPPASEATFACGALRLEVEGPARVRAMRGGFDLLAGAARASGDGVVGTSRGPLTCDGALVDLVESAAGFELGCEGGAARLVAHETHQLVPGARLRFALASSVPAR